MMKNISFIIKESHMSYYEVIQLPYGVFLSLLKQFTVLRLEETQEGQEYLEECRRLRQKEADLTAVRRLKNELNNN